MPDSVVAGVIQIPPTKYWVVSKFPVHTFLIKGSEILKVNSKLQNCSVNVFYEERPYFSYQHTEEVEVLRSPRVVSTLVLELGVPVEGVQVLLSELGEKT